MFHLKNCFVAGCITCFLGLPMQAQESPLGPVLRWGAELGKSDTTTPDVMKKMAQDLSDFKSRLQFWEEQQAKHHHTSKEQLQAMQDTLKGMQAHCERMQTDLVAMKANSGITQAGFNAPKKPIEEGMAAKTDVATQDQMTKQYEELVATRQDMLKLVQQVQANTRELSDLKKKYDALQLEFIQAQNDIGKLQQDMVKTNTRLDSGRVQPESSGSDRTRQSFALPLPPDSQSSAAVKSTLGTLKLVNNYPLTVTVVVDGQFYSLRSGDSLSLNRAPGYVTYEVIGIQGNTLRTINPAETLTVQIYPR